MSLCVGLLVSDKKFAALNLQEFVDIAKGKSVRVVRIDLKQPLEHQGPFDVIVHKLTNLEALALLGDAEAAGHVASIKAYLVKHPQTTVLDPLDRVEALLDRGQTLNLLTACHTKLAGVQLSVPTSCPWTPGTDPSSLIEQNELAFPLIIKPMLAHGSSEAHSMALAFTEEGLSHWESPCILQQFVEHNAALHKIFVLGDSYACTKRPSIRSIAAPLSGIFAFDSNQVSKPHSATHLNGIADAVKDCPDLDPVFVAHLVPFLRTQLQLSMFGVDGTSQALVCLRHNFTPPVSPVVPCCFLSFVLLFLIL
eukprot:m.19803 g.19803  ORF g.19803 m.19803 type:complete len:309 (-) comp8085_c0_seq4:1587-2513(-)